MNLTPSWLMASVLVGALGAGLFIYGKKQSRAPQLLAGILLFVDSCVVPDVLWMYLGAGAVIGLLWGALRAGV